MKLVRMIAGVVLAAGLAWAAYGGYGFVRDLSADRAAARAIAPRLANGERLVPARRDKNLRGDENADYWCFIDGLCFYPIGRFRVLYPAYNDLEDDALIREVIGQGMRPRRRTRGLAR